MYRFYLPIGDWSGDGHGQCSYFMAQSNKPVEDVREAHYRIKDVTGIDIESMCSVYDEDELGRDMVTALREIGFPFEKYGRVDPAVMGVREMADLWVFLLRKVDNDLDLTIVVNDIPMLPFYGFDENGRHISQVGYGLFA